MNTIVELNITGKFADGDTYNETFTGEELAGMTDEELIDYAKDIYQNFNDSEEDPADHRTLVGIVKVTKVIVNKELL